MLQPTAAVVAIWECETCPPPALFTWLSDYFPKMMKELSGQHLDRDDKVITVVDHFLEVQDTEKNTKNRSVCSMAAGVRM